MDKSAIIPLIAIGVSIAGFLASHLRTKSAADLRTDVELLKKQMSLFWGVIEKNIGNMLHSPHRAELDRLIEKNQRGEHLEKQDVKRFADLLHELAEDKDSTHGEQAAALLLKAVVIARHSNVNH